MTTNNVNVKMPPMLPTMPLPLNVVTSNVMYMYSCSQCEFKTHIESLFKQHVDSVHLGIPNVPNNLVLGQSYTESTTQSSTTVSAARLAAATAQVAAATSPASVVVTKPAAEAVTKPAAEALTSMTLPSGVISVTQPNQTFVMTSGGQLVATGGQITPATVVTQGVSGSQVSLAGSVSSVVDKLHKCPKCNILLPSKNQLNLHKRKVHGKVSPVIMAAGTGGAIPSAAGVTYAVVSSQPSTTTVQPSSSVVASLVSLADQ